jgi:hypothetical protein
VAAQSWLRMAISSRPLSQQVWSKLVIPCPAGGSIVPTSLSVILSSVRSCPARICSAFPTERIAASRDPTEGKISRKRGASDKPGAARVVYSDFQFVYATLAHRPGSGALEELLHI